MRYENDKVYFFGSNQVIENTPIFDPLWYVRVYIEKCLCPRSLPQVKSSCIVVYLKKTILFRAWSTEYIAYTISTPAQKSSCSIHTFEKYRL